MNDAKRVDHPGSADGYPASWLRGTADEAACDAETQAVPGGEAPRLPVDLRSEWKQRCSALEAEVKELRKHMSPYILDLIASIARTLALAVLQHAPDEYHKQFVFEGPEVGAAYDEVIVITYERKRKPTTLPIFVVAEVPEMVNG